MLSKPESDMGQIYHNSEALIVLDVYETSEEQFTAYVNACERNGFVFDQTGSVGYYLGKDAGGHCLMLDYCSDERIMTIAVYSSIESSGG